MTPRAGDVFRLNVLNPGGLDREQDFSGPVVANRTAHAPVNFHAYAACTGGRFFRAVDRAVAAKNPVLLLLRGDFRASERALLALKKARVPVAVSLKETGLHQIAEQLEDSARLERFTRIVLGADACIAPTPEAADIYRSLRRSDTSVAFIPTPYPLHDSQWNFLRPIPERRGIFVGTREWEIPTRNHAAALMTARRISDCTGDAVTVYNVEYRKGKRLLQGLGFPKDRLRVFERTEDYPEYLRVLAGHKVVFQLDTSLVPGQVAGDALLCRLPCVGGNGAVDRLAFNDICGVNRSIADLAHIVTRLLQDAAYYTETVAISQTNADERLSFQGAAAELGDFFGRIALKH